MKAFRRAGRGSRMAKRLLVVAGFAALLGGCYQTPVAQTNVYPVNFRARHPITIGQGVHTVRVFIGRNRGGLTPDQRADVLAFAQTWRHNSTSGIIIDVPHGRSTDRAAADSLHEIYSVLAASGVPRRAIYVRHHPASSASLVSIRLNYTKLTAHAGPCGLWPTDIGPSDTIAYKENLPYWNFGCATQQNLAAMVADPADLVQPRGETPADEARRSVAIEKWQKGANPSGTYTGIEKAKISKLGQ